MSDYPAALPICAGSTEEPIDDYRWTRSQAGGGSAVSNYTTDKRKFSVRHVDVDLTLKQTLDTFHAANRTESFNFTWLDGSVYVVIFVGGIRRSLPNPAQLYTLEVALEEV